MPLFLILGIPLAKFFYRYLQNEFKYTVDRSTFKMEIIHGKAKPKLLYETDIKDMDFATIIPSNIELFSTSYETAITRCIDFDLDWVQFRTPDKYSLPYFTYLYDEKDTIYYKAKQIITDDFTDKLFRKEFFVKYDTINEMLKHTKRIGIIGVNSYKKNNQ